VVSGGELHAPVAVTAAGTVTSRIGVTIEKYQPDQPLYLQWEVATADGAAVAARSSVARIVPFCPRGGCTACPADLGAAGGVHASDGVLDNNDFIAFIDLFFANAGAADIGRQGGVSGPDAAWDNNDFIVFIQRFFDGC